MQKKHEQWVAVNLPMPGVPLHSVRACLTIGEADSLGGGNDSGINVWAHPFSC